MALEFEIKFDKNYLDRLDKESKSDVPRTLRFFGALFERRAKRSARSHSQGGNFWRSIANSITTNLDRDSVSVGAVHVAAGHKETGGTIRAPGQGPGSRNAKNLTIPIDDEAIGKNVGDFRKEDLITLKSRKNNKIIFKKMPGGEIKPLYLLKPAVDQKPEPWFPFKQAPQDLDQAMRENMRIFKDAN